MLVRRAAPRIRIPYGTECVSWSLDVSGGESVVVAGADSTTIDQPSYQVPAAIHLHVNRKW